MTQLIGRDWLLSKKPIQFGAKKQKQMADKFIELTEIVTTGKYWWKKHEPRMVLINVNKIEVLRNALPTGTEIETDVSFFHVSENIADVINLIGWESFQGIELDEPTDLYTEQALYD